MLRAMKTVQDIIDAFGGGGILCADLGYRHPSRISNWKKTGIPRSVWPDLLDLGRKRRVRGLNLDALRAANANVAVAGHKATRNP